MSMILCHVLLNKMVVLSHSLGQLWIKHRQCIFMLAFLILTGSFLSHMCTYLQPHSKARAKLECPMSFYSGSQKYPDVYIYYTKQPKIQ